MASGADSARGSVGDCGEATLRVIVPKGFMDPRKEGFFFGCFFFL